MIEREKGEGMGQGDSDRVSRGVSVLGGVLREKR